MFDAVRFLVAEGVRWASLPAGFPKWRAVYRFFRRWRDNDFIKELHGRLCKMLRALAGKKEEPTAAIIDSQSVKADATVSAATPRLRRRTLPTRRQLDPGPAPRPGLRDPHRQRRGDGLVGREHPGHPPPGPLRPTDTPPRQAARGLNSPGRPSASQPRSTSRFPRNRAACSFASLADQPSRSRMARARIPSPPPAASPPGPGPRSARNPAEAPRSPPPHARAGPLRAARQPPRPGPLPPHDRLGRLGQGLNGLLAGDDRAPRDLIRLDQGGLKPLHLGPQLLRPGQRHPLAPRRRGDTWNPARPLLDGRGTRPTK